MEAALPQGADWRTKVIAALRIAEGLLRPWHHWTRCAVARDAFSRPVFSTDDIAACWCLTGAVRRACRLPHAPHCIDCETTNDALDALETTLVTTPVYEDNNCSPMGFNDDPMTKHHHVMTLLRRTIERLEKASA